MSGVLLPELHCALIALELYLKSLSATEVEVPDTVLGFGAYIYATSPAKSHKLEDLYNLVDPSDREIIDRKVVGKERLRTFASSRLAFAAHSAIFMSSRYPFEPDSTIKGIDMGGLTQLLEAVEEAVAEVPHRFVTK